MRTTHLLTISHGVPCPMYLGGGGWVPTPGHAHSGGMSTHPWIPGYSQKGPGTRDARPHIRDMGPEIPPLWTDRHLWKHYLPVTSFAGGNDSNPSPPPLTILPGIIEEIHITYLTVLLQTTKKQNTGWNWTSIAQWVRASICAYNSTSSTTTATNASRYKSFDCHATLALKPRADVTRNLKLPTLCYSRFRFT